MSGKQSQPKEGNQPPPVNEEQKSAKKARDDRWVAINIYHQGPTGPSGFW